MFYTTSTFIRLRFRKLYFLFQIIQEFDRLWKMDNFNEKFERLILNLRKILSTRMSEDTGSDDEEYNETMAFSLLLQLEKELTQSRGKKSLPAALSIVDVSYINKWQFAMAIRNGN